MNYCGACGAPTAGEGTKFCGRCGAALTAPAGSGLPPLKAAKKTNTGALVVGFVSVVLLAGGVTVVLLS